MSAKFTSIEIIGGRQPVAGKPTSFQNPDLWVKGGAIINQALLLNTIEPAVEGIDIFGDVTFHGNIIGGNISGEGSSFSAGTTGLLPNTATLGPVTLSGTLRVSNGGTGLATIPTNGQLLVGNGTGYSLNALSSGTGISVVNTSGAITLNNTGVTALSGGTAISVSGSTGTVTVNNTGVTVLGTGTGLSSSGSTGSVTLTNTGVTGLSAGAFMTISGSTGVVTIASTGPVASITGGTGISASTSTGAITITNTGVTGLSGGTAINVSGSTGSITVTNTGVTGLSAGSGIAVSASTGGVLVSNTGVLSLGAGAGIVLSGATGSVTISTDLVMDDSADPSYPQTTSNGVWYGNNTKSSVNSTSVAIGNDASATGEGCVSLGHGAVAEKRTGGVSIGYFANVQDDWGLAVGAEASVSGAGGIAIGHASFTKYPLTMAFGQEANVLDTAHPIAYVVNSEGLKRDAIGYSVNGDVAVQQRNTSLGLVYNTDDGDLALTDVGPGTLILVGTKPARITLQDTRNFSVGSCLEVWNQSSDVQSIFSATGDAICVLERHDEGIVLGEAVKLVLIDPDAGTWFYRKYRTDF